MEQKVTFTQWWVSWFLSAIVLLSAGFGIVAAAHASSVVSSTWSTRTVTEVALYSGFTDATHFGRVFKVRYGLTPRDYRRNSRMSERG